MRLSQALYSMFFVLFLLLFGARDIASEKDFVYIDLPKRVRRALYIRKIPTGKISLSGVIWQGLLACTLLLQVVSILGLDILHRQFVQVLLKIPAEKFNAYFFTVFRVIELCALLLIDALYFLLCTIFVRKDKRYWY